MPETQIRHRSQHRWPSVDRPVSGRTTRQRRRQLVSDRQWSRVEPFILDARNSTPRLVEQKRRALEGVLWALKHGSAWSEIPREVGSSAASRRHWKMWMRDGRWFDLWRAYVATLGSRQWLAWSQALVRAGETLALPGGGKSRSARYAWWMVSARVFLWEAPWVPSNTPGGPLA
jgi:hypothetical protein